MFQIKYEKLSAHSTIQINKLKKKISLGYRTKQNKQKRPASSNRDMITITQERKSIDTYPYNIQITMLI